MSDIKVGVICPTRGDRPKFLEQFKKYVSRQTLQPTVVEIVDFEPTDDSCDITKRYKYGYDKLRGQGLDLIGFLEDDEFYAPNYLEVMVDGWIKHGCPKMFGLDYTIYYHLLVGKDFVFKHDKRASMMSTLMKPDMSFEWCRDDYAYTDSHLWKTVGGKVWNPRMEIAIGIKHGLGMTGGQYHTNNLQKYNQNNIDFRRLVGEEDFSFYQSLYPPNVKLIRDKQKGLVIYGL